MKRLTFFAAGFLLTAHSVAAQNSLERLSVDQAVSIALNNSRRLANARFQADKAGHDVETARSRRMPKFVFEAQVSELVRPVHVLFPQGALGFYPGTGPIPATDTSITTSSRPSIVIDAQVTQPLSRLPELSLNIRMSEAAQALELETMRATRLTVVYDVKRAYYAIQQNESALEAAEHNLALLRELGRVVGDRVVQNVALKSDALDIDTRLARAEQQRLTLSHAVASQKEQLNRLMGRDLRTPFETAGIPGGEPVVFDLASAQARALESSPGVRQSRLKRQQAEVAHRIARAERFPEISLSATYLSPMNINGAPRNIASVGVQLQWEPFDWGRRSRAIASRALDIQEAGNALEDEEDRTLIEVNAQYRRLEESRAALRVARLTQDTARENSRVRTAQYRSQSALLSDVLQAAVNQAEADNQFQQALAAHWLAAAEFERVIGED